MSERSDRVRSLDESRDYENRAEAALGQPKKYRRILDVVEANAGRQVLITADVPAAIGELGRGTEKTILDLNGDSQVAQVVTVVFAAFDPRGFPGGAVQAAEPGVPVGIIRFGNGGGVAEVEIDIPNPNSHTHGQQNATNAVAISLPAGRMRVTARDDGRIIPGLGQSALVPDNVNGGQMVSAFVVYGHRGSPSRVYRTLFFAVNTLQSGMGNAVTLRVPPFARSVRFVRYPKAELSIQFALGWLASGGPFILEDITVPYNETSPTYPIPPRCTQLQISCSNAVDSGMAVFEIAL